VSGGPGVSVIGLGLMGRPMARNLVGAGFAVTGWNRSPLRPELTGGIPLASDLDSAAGAEIVLLMLADSAAVGEVLDRIGPRLRAGQLVLDMGSSNPVDTIERAAALADRGVGWVDAPVSGGALGAESGRLAIMAGASGADFEQARPVLEALGEGVVHVGGPGAGHTAKVVNQVIVALALEAVAEGLAIAEASGLDPRLVQRALRGGWADSRILQEQGTRMIERDFVPGGRVRTLRKDLDMALGLAARLGLDLPHTRSARAIFDDLAEHGAGDLDCAVVYRSLRENAQSPSSSTEAV
jgi:3-hydroxyisobutyrate dehydrogenase-like beta-hydroxyacid dehydrogenase